MHINTLSRTIVMKRKGFNLLEYLYYRTTLLYSRIESRSGFADNKLTGAWVVSTFVFINFISVTLPLTYMWLGERMLTSDSNDHDFIVIGIIIASYIIINLSTLFFLTRKQHSKIFENYRNETSNQKESRTRLLLIYVALTFTVLLFVAIYGKYFIDSVQ